MMGFDDKYSKYFVALRYWLLGKEYYLAIKALDYSRDHHTGSRRDGTPVSTHPLVVTMYVQTLHTCLLHPERSLATALLHDIVEDTGTTLAQVENLFGRDIAHSVNLVTKKKDGIRRSDEEYFNAMSDDAAASIVKGADRIHNAQTMLGAFSLDKQKEYIRETSAYILPMLKRARHRFPEQQPAYENMKLILVSQIELIEAVHQASDENRAGKAKPESA